ncbi:TetR/AcrR family transcriptional regulator [Rhodococcus sp. NPDC003348]
MNDSRTTLRARHRARTALELHAAAMSLAREHGLPAATIDAITDRAGVSRRTFFNYFASKEDAILGTSAPSAPEDALSRYFDSGDGDRFTRTMRLIVAVVQSTFGPTSATDVPALVREFPVLRERLSEHVSAAEKLVGAALDEHAAGGAGGAGGHRSAESTRALVMLAGTVLRFAYTRDPSALNSAHSDALESAISVFRNAIEEIS